MKIHIFLLRLFKKLFYFAFVFFLANFLFLFAPYFYMGNMGIYVFAKETIEAEIEDIRDETIGRSRGRKPDPENDVGSTSGDSSGEEEGTECTKSLSLAAKKAASGMDLQSVALMGKTIGDATQAASGGSASKAHKANVTIQGGLSGIALKRYTKCTSAISRCEDLCEPKKVESDCQRKIHTQPPNREADIKACKEDAQAVLEECIAQSAVCSQSGLAALMAGVNAAASMLAAKQLGSDGNGENDDEDNDDDGSDTNINHPTPDNPNAHRNDLLGGTPPSPAYKPEGDEDDPNRIAGPSSPPPVFGRGGDSPLGQQHQGSFSGNELNPQGGPSLNPADANNDKSSNRKRLLARKKNSGKGGTPTFAGSKNSSGTLSGNLGKNTSASKGDSEDVEDSDSERAGDRRRYSPSSSAGSFAGDRSGANFSGRDRGYDSLRSKRGRSRLASLNRKKMDKDKKRGLKRNAFSKESSRGAIFNNMSQFIQSYCSEKCH